MNARGHDGLKVASTRKGPRVLSWFFGGLGLLLVALSPLQADSPAGPGTKTTAFQDTGPQAGIRIESGSSAGLSYAPGQMIVKYRDTVTQPVNRLIERGQSFQSATTDRSDSLDKLHKKYGVRSARPIFRTDVEEAFLSGADEPAVKRFHEDKLRDVKQKFSHRTLRAPKGAALPDLGPVYVLELSAASDAEAVAAEFRKDPHVEYAQPNYRAKTSFVPNDSYYGSTGSWGQPEDDLWGLKKIQMGAAWDIAQGNGVVVAVVDTGLDKTHSEISANVWSNADEVAGNGIDDDGNGYIDDTWGWDFAYGDNDPTDGYGHGTHVAGTIAAVGTNRKGIIGVAYKSKVMPLQGLDDTGSGSISSLAAGIVYAAENGADVINNSWGCTARCPSNPVAEDAVRLAHGLGAVVVFAAGNSGDDVAYYSPQNIPESIKVSASTPEDQAAFFSNYGGGLDVAAPGGGDTNPPPAFDPFRNILSLKSATCDPSLCPSELIVGNKYLRQAGTSMAAPHVSGVAALVLSAHPEFLNEQVRQAIRRGSDDRGPVGFDQTFGYGRLNAAGALAQLPLAVFITQPQSGEVITGGALVDVYGIAEGVGFASWALEYGAGANPTGWVAIATSTTPVSGVGLLATWDTGSVADGVTTLRLTGRKTNGETYEYLQTITIDTVAITDPQLKLFAYFSPFRGGDPITITGTAAPAGFSGYGFEVRDSLGQLLGDPAITLPGGGLQPVRDGVLGTWDTTGVPADHYTIELVVNLSGGGRITESTPVLVDPTLHPGWPKSLSLAGTSLAPNLSFTDHITAADLNGDGLQELLVGYGSTVQVFQHDGSPLPGWPQTVDPGNNGGIFIQRGPAAGDLTGDGRPEIVATSNYGVFFVWSADGTLLPGWPKTLGVGQNAQSIDDINGDGLNEIIGTNWPSVGSGTVVQVVDRDGNYLPGWPRTLGIDPVFLSPASIGDVDGDGQKEIAVVETSGSRNLYLFGPDGTDRPGWPKAINPPVSPNIRYASYPAMGDLDGDGDLEIVIGSVDGKVYAFHGDGTAVAGWPQTTQAAVVTSPVIGDITGDGRPEVIAGLESLPDNSNYLYAWRTDGTLLPGWPVVVHQGGVSNQDWAWGVSGPALADVDGDGLADVIVSSGVSSDHLSPLHAIRYDGTEIPGFPKLTAAVSSYTDNTVAIADLDGDGLLEMAWVDMSYNLMVWDLSAPASGPMPWPMFHHDAGHTGANVGESASVPNFDLAVAPASRSVIRGGSTTYNIALTSRAGYSGTVGLSMAANNPTIAGSFSPNPVFVPAGGSDSSILTVTTDPAIPPGTYTLTIRGTDGVITHTGMATLEIQGPMVVTEAASTVSVFEATLNGTVDPNGEATDAWFEWGTTPAYGNTTPRQAAGSGTSAVAFSQTLTGLTPGATYHFRAAAQNASATTYGQDRTFTTRNVDLITSNVTGPSMAALGSYVDISVTVLNQGTDTTGVGSVGIYLSADPQMNGGSIFLGVLSVSGVLGGGESATVTLKNKLIPTNIAPGNYYWIGVADLLHMITETNESNNIGSAPVQITASDLAMTAVSGPSTAPVGSAISVSNTVLNQGISDTPPGSSGTFRVGLYLSDDINITTSDVLLASRVVNGLPATQSSGAETLVGIPLSTPAGQYYLGAIADDLNAITESDETNNALAGNSIVITATPPDLTVTAVSGPTSARRGNTITGNVTVYNQGTTATGGGFTVALYLSTDGVITSGDISLGTVSASALNAFASQTIPYSKTVPTSMAKGTYYIGAIADSANVIVESNENNNSRAGNTISIR